MSKTYLKEAVPAARVAKDLADVRETVAGVIADIRERGDQAVREYSAKFDNWSPGAFLLTAAQVDDIVAGLPDQAIEVDLLSQAEHGPDSPAILVTTSRSLGEKVLSYVAAILPGMPTRDFAWPSNSTNHVLPTRGAARYTGGLWVGKYLKTVTYQEVRDPASSALLGDVCGRASRVELFEGHARSGDIRGAKIRGTRPGDPGRPHRADAAGDRGPAARRPGPVAGRHLRRFRAGVGRCAARRADRRGHRPACEQRGHRRPGEAGDGHRACRMGRGVFRERAVGLPDVPTFLPAMYLRGSGDVINIARCSPCSACPACAVPTSTCRPA